MWYQRTELLVGEDGIQKLQNACVAVFGLGGVGSYVVEALARAGVGKLILTDFDVVEPTNINRQLIALNSTVDQKKIDVTCARILDINPDTEVIIQEAYATPDNIAELIPDDVGFAVDAIDAVASKVALVKYLYEQRIKFVSCMGAGNKLDPTSIRVCDISNTRVCPLARVIRQRLKKRGINKGITCVYSEEKHNISRDSDKSDVAEDSVEAKRKDRIQGSISYIPGLVGLTAAGVIVNKILEK